jgi:hypothetical protein
MTLLDDLNAFSQEHRRCGELEGEVTEDEPGWVVMWCTCGARIAHHEDVRAPALIGGGLPDLPEVRLPVATMHAGAPASARAAA